MARTVIVGAGVAGVQTALELRQRGYEGEITLVSDESEEPYDRPPLSKEYLKGGADRQALGLLTSAIAADRSIDLRLGVEVTGLDTAAKAVALADGARLGYDHLVLATGAHNRRLTVPGADAAGIWSLRRLDEADALRAAIKSAANVVVVGGGFIGLEVAAAARSHGADVTVVEFLPRVMARVLSPAMSQHFHDTHVRHGVRILTEVAVEAILVDNGRATGVRLGDGTEVQADLVVVGVGVVPATELAERAGLDVADGVVVDGQLRTSDPAVFAIGDCVRFECLVTGHELRLESIQNAADQARFVASRITDAEPDDQPAPYSALPWFWTEQFDAKLQIAGVATGEADSVVRGDPASGSFSVCRFVGERLAAVESVNQPRDHIAARKLLVAPPEAVRRVTRASVADAGTALKSLLDT